MTKIFISYRKADTQHIAERITDRLRDAAFTVFIDVVSLKPGHLWRLEIDAALGECEVMLVVIGNSWLKTPDESGQQRIRRDDDYVRYEVRTALERGVPLIPVLVDAAGPPSSADLPEDIRGLEGCQAARVRSDPDFDRDTERLISSIRLHAPSNGKGSAIKLGYLTGKLEVFLRSTGHVNHRRAAEPVIQKITWLANHLGLAFDVDRRHEGALGDMRLSTADLRGDLRTAFEVGYQIGRFYGMALAYVATGLVQDDTITDLLLATVSLLPKADLPTDLLDPVIRHWHGISEHTDRKGPLDPEAINSAEAEADRIIDQLGR